MSRRSACYALPLVVGILVCLGESALPIRASSASPFCTLERTAYSILSSSQSTFLLSEADMRDPPDSDHMPDGSADDQSADPREQLRQVEASLRDRNLIFRRDVQLLLKAASCTHNPTIRQSALQRLEIARRCGPRTHFDPTARNLF